MAAPSTSEPRSIGFVNQFYGFWYFSNEPSKPTYNLAFYVLMNPAKLGKHRRVEENLITFLRGGDG